MDKKLLMKQIEGTGYNFFWRCRRIAKDLYKVLDDDETVCEIVKASLKKKINIVKPSRDFVSYVVRTNKKFIYIESGRMYLRYIPFLRKTVVIPLNEIRSIDYRLSDGLDKLYGKVELCIQTEESLFTVFLSKDIDYDSLCNVPFEEESIQHENEFSMESSEYLSDHVTYGFSDKKNNTKKIMTGILGFIIIVFICVFIGKALFNKSDDDGKDLNNDGSIENMVEETKLREKESAEKKKEKGSVEKKKEKGSVEKKKESAEKQNEKDGIKKFEDMDLADYLSDFSVFVKKFPDMMSEASENSYYDETKMVMVRCDKKHVPEYISIEGEPGETPALYSIKPGMKESSIKGRLPNDYELLESDEYGSCYYSSANKTYILWYADVNTREITRLVYLTENGFRLYWEDDASVQPDNLSWEYILPESDRREYLESELAGLSADDIQMAVNEIYARHGRKFNTKSIQDYFSSKSWYKGTVAPEDFSESVLSEVEKKNLKTLTALHDRIVSKEDIVHTEMVIFNNAGFDFAAVYLKPANESEWGNSLVWTVYDGHPSQLIPMDIDRNHGLWDLMVCDYYGQSLQFSLDLSDIDASCVNEFGGNNLLEISFDGGDSYTCKIY